MTWFVIGEIWKMLHSSLYKKLKSIKSQVLDFLFYCLTLKYNADILKDLFALGIKG